MAEAATFTAAGSRGRLRAISSSDQEMVAETNLMRVVFDTSVLVAAARSRSGASFALVSAIPSPSFEISLSVALYLEWQDALTRAEHLPPGQTADNALGFLRFLAAHAFL
jgi:hypothetical protein